MTSPLPDAADVQRALKHQFSVYGHTVEAAMSVVLPALRRRDEEIERLRGIVAGYVVTGKSGSEEKRP